MSADENTSSVVQKAFPALAYSFMTGQEIETGLAVEQSQLRSDCHGSKKKELECSDPASLHSIKCKMSRGTDVV